MAEGRDVRWVDLDQPNQLTNATLLLYLSAVFAIFSGFVGIVVAVAEAVGAFGIANHRRWGYGLALAGAGAEVVFGLFYAYRDVTAFVNFVFAGVLLYLLLHPLARTHVREHFR